MTQEQIITSIKKLKAYYPYFYNNISKEDAKAIVEVWLEHFGKLDYKYMQDALKSWGASKDKPPTIADLRKQIGSYYHKVDDLYSRSALTAEEKEKLEVQRTLLWEYLCGRCS